MVASFAPFVMLIFDTTIKNQAIFVLNHLIDQVMSERLWRDRQLTLGLFQIQLLFWQSRLELVVLLRESYAGAVKVDNVRISIAYLGNMDL